LIDYEVTYILRPTLEENEVEARSGTIAELVRGGGGEIVNIDRMGKRRLAYEIADVREGSYVSMRFRSDAATAKELERQLRLNEEVLRALLIRLEEHELQAAPPAPATEETEDGG